MKSIFRFLFGKEMWWSRLGVLSATSFLTLIWFVVDWSASTTFRSMSDWMLWVVNILGALVLTLPYLLTRRVWVQGLVLLLADFLLLANIMYCRTYFTAIPPESYALVSNLGDFTASVWDSLSWLDLGIPLILMAGVTAAYSVPRFSGKRVIVRYLCCMGLMAVISGVGITLRGGFYRCYDQLVQQCYYSTCGTPTYTVAGHLAYSLMDGAKRVGSSNFDDIDQWIADHGRLMPYTVLPDSVPHRKNLVVIICESLESWVIGAQIDGKPVTPYLNSLVADSTTFYAPNVLTQVAAGRSIECQLLMHSGLLPMIGTVYSMKYPASTYPSIPKAMREKYGAESIIFTCDKPITWNQEAISRAFGYDSLIDRRSWVIDEVIGNPAKLSDGSFLRQSVKKIQDDGLWPEGQPAMLTFVTYSGHSPFKLPDRMKDKDFDISAQGFPRKLEDYITMAHYTDSQLPTLVEYIRSRRDYEDTMILIIGDHEGLASWRNEIRSSSPTAANLVSEGQFTPFILLNSPVAGREETVMGQVNIYTTLLQALRLDDYPWKGMGESMFYPSVSAAVSVMPGAFVGSSDSISPDIRDHMLKSCSVSYEIICFDYMRDFLLHKSTPR